MAQKEPEKKIPSKKEVGGEVQGSRGQGVGGRGQGEGARAPTAANAIKRSANDAEESIQRSAHCAFFSTHWGEEMGKDRRCDESE